ncbi:hypothetical protein AMS62_23975 [Bacillus sp. FJAT-18019]|nr:hypothetical protein AMS62_23975 [Bacillus sp. FJAT-18019]
MNNKPTNDFPDKPFTIECEDILLREYMMGDLDAIYQITHVPEIRAFLHGKFVIGKQHVRRHSVAI